MGVGVTVGVGVSVGVGVTVGLSVTVGEGVRVGVSVGPGVGVEVRVPRGGCALALGEGTVGVGLDRLMGVAGVLSQLHPLTISAPINPTIIPTMKVLCLGIIPSRQPPHKIAAWWPGASSQRRRLRTATRIAPNSPKGNSQLCLPGIQDFWEAPYGRGNPARFGETLGGLMA